MEPREEEFLEDDKVLVPVRRVQKEKEKQIEITTETEVPEPKPIPRRWLVQ